MTLQAGRRVLVVGGGGLVGGAVVAAASKAGHDVIATSRGDARPDQFVDLRDVSSIRRVVAARERVPELIILTAATTNVAGCEAAPGDARRINVDGTRAVVDVANSVGAKVTFLSSDYVFGDGGPHHEADDAAPMNQYGRQKLEAEEIVLEHAANLVIRTCQVFGQDARRANYVLSVVDRLVAGETVRARADLFGTPTYAPDLAREIVELGTGDAVGIWHVAGPDLVSRFQLARAVASSFGFDEGAVIAAKGPDGPDDVSRPKSAGLMSIRGRSPLRSVAAGLADLRQTPPFTP